MIYPFIEPFGPDLSDAGLPEGVAEQFIGFRTDADAAIIAQYDPEVADLRTAAGLAAEVTHLAGAPVDVFIRTDNRDYDRVWDEDPDPTYWPAVPLNAFFAPKALEVALKQWGPDAEVKLDIVFALGDIKSTFGERSLRSGDVIYVPFNAIGNATPKYFRVISAGPDNNYRYSWMYLLCRTASLTGDVTVQPQPNGVLQIGDYDD